jgi:small subunit ribosomal protein S1
MEELLARSPLTIKSFHVGEIVKSKITAIDSRSVTLDIGGKSEGVVTGPNYDEVAPYIHTLKVGDIVKAAVVDSEGADGFVKLSFKQFAADAIWDKLAKAKEKKAEIEVRAKNITDKGIVVELGSLSAFIPNKELGKVALKNPQRLLETPFKVQILELNKFKNRILLSERAISEGEEIALEELAVKSLKEGEVYDGLVTQVTNFGIFVQIKVGRGKKQVSVEGLVHVSELAWEKTDDPAELYQEGDHVKVAYIGLKDGKVALSVKQALPDPWETIEKKYQVDQKVKGKVVRKSGFGVFVELEPGVEGLIHLTKIPPSVSLEKGSEVNCYIEEINKDEHRISLGIILTAKPIGYK